MKDHPPTACCNYVGLGTMPHPVFWNPYNKVVQCHNCGHVYEPVLTRSIYNEVSKQICDARAFAMMKTGKSPALRTHITRIAHEMLVDEMGRMGILRSHISPAFSDGASTFCGSLIIVVDGDDINFVTTTAP